MLQTETSKSRKQLFDAYQAKYLVNREFEWLIEKGKIRESIYFKGETGDRYTIYIATKRSKNIIDIGTIYNSYSHGTELGVHIATLRGYILTIHCKSHSWSNSNNYYGIGYTFKQLMRQGVMSKKHSWKTRYCRSAHFIRLDDGTEFTPWNNMKMNIKDGTLVTKPNKVSIKLYNIAKNQDTDQRKRNYIANRENSRALDRYRKAGGDTESARGGWNQATQKWKQPEVGVGLDKINWDMIPIDDVFRHRNATLRSNIIEHFGMNAILNNLENEVVDEETIDGRHYKLLDVTIPDFSNNRAEEDTYKGLYLEMINPSTGESHFEGVPNASSSGWANSSLKKATVKAALSWRDDDMLMQSNNTIRSNAPDGSEYTKPIVLK